MHKIVDIRRNDNVRVITGRDKGKEGRVLRVIPRDGQGAGRARDDGEEERSPESAEEHQGRHRRAGKRDRHQQRDADVQLVQAAGARRSRKAWRQHVRVCKNCETTLEK